MSRDPEEVWSSDYDSTWEEEGEEKPRGHREPGNRRQPNNCRKWMSRAARDLQNYRHGYEKDKNYQYHSPPPQQTPNLDFYQNKRRFEPDGLYITQLLEKWKGKYDMLERNHSYIQWLFPLQEYGMNSCAKPLTKAEMEAMKKDPVVQERFLAAYKLMLDFYGIQLENEETGKLTHADNWESRFRNLNDHSHNNLRITRILKCLGELGFEHYQAPLVKFFLVETLCNGRLQNVKRSALDYFMFTVKNKIERRRLVHYAWKNYNQDKFIWGPVEKLRSYQPPADDEQEANNCRKDKSNDVKEESKINGQLGSRENNFDKGEVLKDCSDSSSSENVECQQDSFQPNKETSEECIPLTKRIERKPESHENFPDKGSGRCPEAVPDDQGLFSSSRMNGGQLLPEEEHKKSNEEKGKCVSPKHDHEVPSAVGHQKEDLVEGPVVNKKEPETPEEPVQQEDAHRETDHAQIEINRKRKRQNVAPVSEETSNSGPPQSNKNPGPPKEEEERMDRGEENFNSELKKLKLSGLPGSGGNQMMADNPPSPMVEKDPQESGDDSDINPEGNETEGEEAKEETPDPHGPSNSDKAEKEDDDPSARCTSGDPK